MKAKEYAQGYQERAATNELEALGWLFLTLNEEAVQVAYQRAGTHNPHDGILLPILREFDLKWRAIARECDLNPNGWRDWWASKGIRFGLAAVRAARET
jgi:hypothetical protein